MMHASQGEERLGTVDEGHTTWVSEMDVGNTNKMFIIHLLIMVLPPLPVSGCTQ